MVFPQGDLSSGWSFIIMVSHQGGLSSEQSFLGFFFHQCVFHQAGLSSWYLIGKVSSARFKVFFHQRFHYTSFLSCCAGQWQVCVEKWDRLSQLQQADFLTKRHGLDCGHRTCGSHLRFPRRSRIKGCGWKNAGYVSLQIKNKNKKILYNVELAISRPVVCSM